MTEQVLRAIQEFVDDPQNRVVIEQACDECEAELRASPGLEMTYRAIFAELQLPGAAAALRSLWVFAFAPAGRSDTHKHSNSMQCTRAWRGQGNLLIGDPGQATEVSLPPAAEASLPQWAVIPPGVYHQAVAGANAWCVVSFQTVPAAELQDEPYQGEPHHYV